jgi:hypothetical protein
MRPSPREQIEPCARCGRPAERPAAASGHVAGQEAGRLPLCLDCLQLLLEDAGAFWDGLRREMGPPPG